MKRSHTQPSERGQALVLMVLAMVALLGFTALAVDGSMLYSDRRHAQNAADAASLAGGGAAGKYFEINGVFWSNWSCSGSVAAAMQEAEDTAISIAAHNGFTIDDDISDNHGVKVICGEDNSTSWPDRYIEIVTKLTKETSTAFVHFVYDGPAVNTVEAVTRVRPRMPLAMGHAIVALNRSGCSGNSNGVLFGGSSETWINGGGVFSNGCLDGDGGFILNVSGDGAGIHYAGEASGMTGANMPPVRTDPLPEDSYLVPEPDCSSLPHRTQSGSVLQPGVYDSLRLNGGSLTLNPGLYCITGANNAIKINDGTVIAHGVTLFLTNPNSDVTISGGVHHLSAPERSPDPSPAIPGILIYSKAVGDVGVKLVGNGDSSYLGTIYVPRGDIDVSGGNDTYPTFNTQLIGYNVKVTGNARIDINFNGAQNYAHPPKLELYK